MFKKHLSLSLSEHREDNNNNNNFTTLARRIAVPDSGKLVHVGKGGRVKDASKVGMRGAESEMNAREGVAFKTRSLHGCLRRVALINERCYREWGEGCGRGKEDRSKATALLRRGGRVALTIVS